MPDVISVDCSTGETTERDFTDEEREQRDADLAAAQAQAAADAGAETQRTEAVAAAQAAVPIVEKLKANEVVTAEEQVTLLKALALQTHTQLLSEAAQGTGSS